MEVQSEFVEPATPVLSADELSFWRTEDSGYHTSFTPGSVECSKENLNVSSSHKRNRRFCAKPKSNYNVLLSNNHNFSSSPIRRGLKRSYQEDTDLLEVSYSSIPTPTSVIAGGIRKLKVEDSSKVDSSFSLRSVSSGRSILSQINNYFPEQYGHSSFPTTPIKKICRSPCKLSPLNYNNSHRSLAHAISVFRSARKLNFTIHSLSCETQGLLPTTKCQIESHPKEVLNTTKLKQNKKLDIIKILYQEKNCLAVIVQIFKYLSNEDIYNFSLVSPTWLQVCDDVTKIKLKIEEHKKFLKENRENIISKCVPSTNNNLNQVQVSKQILRDAMNKLNNNTNNTVVRSPPLSPKTNKFKQYTKVASLDSREQLVCVRCTQPAKVTKEKSGEVWAECSSYTCSYQFCKFCQCKRHPSKRCFQYDLEGPSPSKRKKETCTVGSKKSRRNLQRLLV